MEKGEAIQTVLMTTSFVPGLIAIVLLPPAYKLSIGLPIFYGVMLGSTFGVNYFAGLRANAWTFWKLRIKGLSYPGGKRWHGQLQYRFQAERDLHFAGITENYIAPDGHTDRQAFVLRCKFETFQKVRHPYANGGGFLPGFVLITPGPHTEMFTEGKESVRFANQSVKGSHTSWGTVDELGAHKFDIRTPDGKTVTVRAGGFSQDRGLRHWPVFYLSDAAGMTNWKRRHTPPKAVLPMRHAETIGGTEVLFCPRCDYEGLPDVPLDVKEGKGKCARGHEMEMPKS